MAKCDIGVSTVRAPILWDWIFWKMVEEIATSLHPSAAISRRAGKTRKTQSKHKTTNQIGLKTAAMPYEHLCGLLFGPCAPVARIRWILEASIGWTAFRSGPEEMAMKGNKATKKKRTPDLPKKGDREKSQAKKGPKKNKEKKSAKAAQ